MTSVSKPKMLVVDDEPRNRKLLQGYLEAAGYDVRVVPDGPSALESAHNDVPDVVLLDVMMSGMNGYEVCVELKSHPRTRLCQVALVTALDGSDHTVEGLDHGADDYITKPIRKDEFLAKVRSLVRVRTLMNELDHSQRELALRNRKLEDLQSLQETLTQTLVHDLKNPLSAVIGNLQLLEMKAAPEQLRLLKRSTTAASRMHRMILDLLDIASLEEGRMSIQQEQVGTLELLSQAIDDVEHAALQKQVELVVGGESTALSIDGDRAMLRRVLDNLITNAVEHSPESGCVTVSCRAREEGIEVSVCDQGPGIPELQRERIFEKFDRGVKKVSGSGFNRGLGLTFCRLAVEAHGGLIWVDTAPEGGAVFRTLLPASEVS